MRRLLILILALLPFAGQAGSSVGQLYKTGGTIDISRAGRTVMADTGSPLEVGDTLEVGLGEAAALRMADDEVVSLGASTRFQLLSYQFNPGDRSGNHARYRLESGTARLISGLIAQQRPGAVVLESDYGMVSTLGTDYSASVCGVGCVAPGIYVSVNSGKVTVSTPAGSQTASAGQIVFVAAVGGAPVLVASLPAGLIPAPDPTPLLLTAGILGSTLRIEFTASVCDEAASPTLPECTASR